MKVGSRAHRDVFCGAFVDTHAAFEPESLPWPVLEGRQLELLRAFPFWGFALGIETEAGRMVSSFAETIDDEVVRKAVALQGYEEARHGRLLAHMFERYGIDTPVVSVPPAPANRDDWAIFGFGECSDSFVGFGGFSIARSKGIFPPPLVEIFERVMFEEARHIVFFINWWRYDEAVNGRTNPITRLGRALRYHYLAAMSTAKGAESAVGDAPPKLDLTGGSAQEILAGVTPLMFLEAALAENRAMMARLDRRLLRPRIVPTLATAALLGLRMLPPRATRPIVAPRAAA